LERVGFPYGNRMFQSSVLDALAIKVQGSWEVHQPLLKYSIFFFLASSLRKASGL
jgi:hypothetical protein